MCTLHKIMIHAICLSQHPKLSINTQFYWEPHICPVQSGASRFPININFQQYRIKSVKLLAMVPRLSLWTNTMVFPYDCSGTNKKLCICTHPVKTKHPLLKITLPVSSPIYYYLTQFTSEHCAIWHLACRELEMVIMNPKTKMEINSSRRSQYEHFSKSLA